MRNHFDRLAKELGQAALGPSGVTVVNDPINAETQYADLRYEPDPARQAARDRLGLLGQIAGDVCLIEVYSQAPSAEEFRACLAKHLAHWQQRARQARTLARAATARDPVTEDPAGDAPVPGVAPFLWVIAAGTPTTLLTKLPMVPAARWPPGVYGFGGDVLRVGLIAARELPRDRTTLLVRLMAAGPLLASAIPEMARLPPDALECTVAEPILLQFERMLGQQETRTSDEQEFLMAMQHTWEDARTEGRAAAHAKDVLTVLRARGIAVSDAVQQRILAEREPARLERWLERASVASSIAEVIDDAG
jgi:post-segregation antitoxin (ccd killing protein)